MSAVDLWIGDIGYTLRFDRERDAPTKGWRPAVAVLGTRAEIRDRVLAWFRANGLCVCQRTDRPPVTRCDDCEADADAVCGALFGPTGGGT